MNPLIDKKIENVGNFISRLGPNVKVRDRAEHRQLMVRVSIPGQALMYDHYITYDDIMADDRSVIASVAKWFDGIAKSTGKTVVEPGIYDLTTFLKESAPVVEQKKKLGKWELHDDDI